MFRFNDNANLHPSGQDFTRRRRHGSVLVSFIIYFSMLVLVLGYSFYKHYHTKDVFLVILLCAVISSLILHALYSIQKNLDMIMAVEFQNALFTSALNLRMDFTILMQRNGSIVYVDRGFRELFPELRAIDDKVLDYLTASLRMDERAKDKFFTALRNYDYEQLVVELTRSDILNEKYMLYLSPLPRPQGYFLIQGRKYVEMRNASKVNREEYNSLGIDATRALLDALPDAAYILSRTGKLEDCNDRFAFLLGYATRSECVQAMNVIEKISPNSAQLFKSERLQLFASKILLNRRDGSTFEVTLQQDVLMKDGIPEGAVGIVLESNP